MSELHRENEQADKEEQDRSPSTSRTILGFRLRTPSELDRSSVKEKSAKNLEGMS